VHLRPCSEELVRILWARPSGRVMFGHWTQLPEMMGEFPGDLLLYSQPLSQFRPFSHRQSRNSNCNNTMHVPGISFDELTFDQVQGVEKGAFAKLL